MTSNTPAPTQVEGAWPSKKMQALAEQTEEAALHNRDQAMTWRRWALASCMSINGGAIVALLNTSEIDQRSQMFAAAWFVLGLLASIAYGFVSAEMMSRWGAYFQHSSWVMRKRAMSDQEADRLDTERFGELIKIDRRVQWIQYAALPPFLIGLGIALEGIT